MGESGCARSSVASGSGSLLVLLPDCDGRCSVAGGSGTPLVALQAAASGRGSGHATARLTHSSGDAAPARDPALAQGRDQVAKGASVGRQLLPLPLPGAGHCSARSEPVPPGASRLQRPEPPRAISPQPRRHRPRSPSPRARAARRIAPQPRAGPARSTHGHRPQWRSRCSRSSWRASARPPRRRSASP